MLVYLWYQPFDRIVDKIYDKLKQTNMTKISRLVVCVTFGQSDFPRPVDQHLDLGRGPLTTMLIRNSCS